MRKKSKPSEDPVLLLKTFALWDEPLMHQYRDVHYTLVLDQLQATGQRIANPERVIPLSEAERAQLMAQHESLRKAICAKYYIAGFEGGDPLGVRKDDWLQTLRVSHSPLLEAETNWQTSLFSPRVRFYIPPKGSKALGSGDHVMYQLPPLPKEPAADTSPLLTLRLDLSQVRRYSLANLMEKLKDDSPMSKGCPGWASDAARHAAL